MEDTNTVEFYVSSEPDVLDMPVGEDISGRCSCTTTTCCCVRVNIQ